MIWIVGGGAVAAVALIWIVVRGWDQMERGRHRLDAYAADLPVDLLASLHDRAAFLIEVELSLSQPRWKSLEAFIEIAATLRRAISASGVGPEFSLADKNRYRRDLGLVVTKTARTRWKSEYEMHRGQREAMSRFEAPASVARGDYPEQGLDEHIEAMAALV